MNVRWRQIDEALVMTSPSEPVEWVFGYGSLMWRPGFAFTEQQGAILHGFHRAFCIYSHHYRGTPENPGLVLGLDGGGECAGTAFRVAPENWDTVVDYLNQRELIGYPYIPNIVPVRIGARTVSAYTFIADTAHPRYAGDLGAQRTAEIIRGASGTMGRNSDYFFNTIDELENRGFQEKRHFNIRQHIDFLTEAALPVKTC